MDEPDDDRGREPTDDEARSTAEEVAPAEPETTLPVLPAHQAGGTAALELQAGYWFG